jgi:hypothetical protein
VAHSRPQSGKRRTPYNTGRQADVNSLAVLIRKRDPVGALQAATGGDPARSERWREVYSRYGVGDELRTAAVDRHGCWGEVFMFRSSDDKPFDADDARLMSAASSIIARTLRVGQVAPMRAGDPAPTEVGVLLVDDHRVPQMTCRGTRMTVVHAAAGELHPVAAWLPSASRCGCAPPQALTSLKIYRFAAKKS